MQFSKIQGNQDVKNALCEMAASGRIPHAIMFYENDGCGALAMILAFLQKILCHQPSGSDSCGECPSCNKVEKLIHPDIHFTFPITTGSKVSGAVKDLTCDMYIKWYRELLIKNPYFLENELGSALGIESKSGTIAVAEAKAIINQLSLTSVQGGYRAVVVYLPEKMNQEAANRLLKSIEEPPEKTLFLMVTHASEKVLQTISSRCQGIRILPLSKDDVVATLVNEFEIDQESAINAAAVSGGSVGKALKYLEDSEDITVEEDIFRQLMDALVSKNLYDALTVGEAMADLDSREKQKAFCKFAGDCLRKIFMLQQNLPDLAGVTAEEKAYYTDLAQKCKKSFPRNAAALFDKAMMLIDRNVSQKMVFCDLVTHLLYII